MRLDLIGLVVALAVPVAASAAQGNGGSTVAGSGRARPAPVFRIALRAEPSVRLRMADRARFAFFLRVTNLTSAVANPNLEASTLRVNGRAWDGWGLTIGNGPVDGRWHALPPGDTLDTGRAMQDAWFPAPGTYRITLEIGADVSPPLVVTVVP